MSGYNPINISYDDDSVVPQIQSKSPTAYTNWAALNDFDHVGVFGFGGSEFAGEAFRDRAYAYGDGGNGILVATHGPGIYFGFVPPGGHSPNDVAVVAQCNPDGSFQSGDAKGLTTTVSYLKLDSSTGTLTFTGGLLTAST